MESKSTTAVKRYSYDQISKLYNVSKSTLYKHVSKKNIKGRQIGTVIKFSPSQVHEIIKDVKRINCDLHPRKINVIELYLSTNRKGRDIAKILSMSVKLTYDCIKEFNSTGCVIVESKLNK